MLLTRRIVNAGSAIGWAGCLIIAYLAAVTLYAFLAPAEAAERQTIFDLGLLVPALAATVLCGAAAWRWGRTRQGWSWLLLGLATSACLLGEATWAYYELILGVEVPTPSIADVSYALYYPLGFAGLVLQLAPSQGRRHSIISALDAVLFTLGSGALSWKLLLQPLLRDSTDPLLAAVNISWPIGDQLVLFATVSLLLRWRLDRVPVQSLALLLGAACALFADTAFIVLNDRA